MIVIPYLPAAYQTYQICQTLFFTPNIPHKKESAAYEHYLNRFPGHQRKLKLEPFLERTGIRKDLRILEHPAAGYGCAGGANCLTRDAVIAINSQWSVDELTSTWILKHEIGHIKYNDLLVQPLLSIAVSMTAAAILTPMATPIPALLLTLVILKISQIVYDRFSERRADDFAIQESSDEELKGGRRFMLSALQSNLQERKLYCGSLFVTETGEDRINLAHPNLSSRLKKIDAALAKRNVPLDELEEDQKVTALTTHLINYEARMRTEEEEKSFIQLVYTSF